jgi:hypothetical protein
MTAKAWAWAQPSRDQLDPATPTPAPTPSGDVVWADADTVLDQGQTGHCVGFGGAQWGNTLPVDDHFTNDDGHKLYYECKVVDGEPKQEDGSNVRSLAKVLQRRGRLKTYAFADTIDDVVRFLDASGPLIFGTDWTNDMFTPAPDGLVRPTGGTLPAVTVTSQSGISHRRNASCSSTRGVTGWGKKGIFEMSIMDAAQLLGQQGEALAAVEL